MHKSIKIIISSILIILWCSFIFYMSSMDSNDSNIKSKNTIDRTIETTLDITNNTGITDIHPSNDKINEVIDNLNTPIRKIAHATEYLILSLLILNLIYIIKDNRKFKYIIIDIILCTIYAITDEYHQTYISGRTGQYMDVLIDSMGSALGSFIFISIYNIKKKITNRHKFTKKVNNISK